MEMLVPKAFLFGETMSKNWLKEILEDATQRIEQMPDWALSPDYKATIKKLTGQSPTTKNTEQHANKTMRDRSGKVNSDVKMVGFLYELMRDYVPVGQVERLVRNNTHENCDSFSFTNGWLAEIAKDMAGRLQ